MTSSALGMPALEMDCIVQVEGYEREKAVVEIDEDIFHCSIVDMSTIVFVPHAFVLVANTPSF